ncbi:protein kinase family protein [Desulfosporosinus nitroreducens]|uniref:Protein kinase family protein n=1 Tax=Desulfosporosinus nitroreducens TaxID=2018668 RepID=A0ABT8QZU0_9FIRM|nr:protein kinase family protein [Desulfosporosinus nitroreducens]MDO0826009.1 protein kinase family protein [Desulfosporosinus nitroreducens]
MNIDNYIETQYRELQPNINMEYEDLYYGIDQFKLKEILTTLHYIFLSSYKVMNERLPTADYTAHFWAEPSRNLIKAIEIATGLQRTLKNSKFAFNFDPYYADLIKKSQGFLSSSGGSVIPEHMDKVELYYTMPIFIMQNSVIVDSVSDKKTYELKFIGEGSYADVFKYKDGFYQKWFVLKRAKKQLNNKELARFKREFEQMYEFNSPYIVEVYCYNDSENSYIMEFMDCTLDKYIKSNNSRLTVSLRKSLANQVLRAFQYIHSKGLLHRDISPKNILLKLYDDVPVIKVSDFGLVKIPDSTLTTVNTEFKGYFNDPALVVEGFDSYTLLHETYALTRLLYFVMTGKTNTEKVNDYNLKIFIEKGLSSDKKQRFQTVMEIVGEFKKL